MYSTKKKVYNPRINIRYSKQKNRTQTTKSHHNLKTYKIQLEKFNTELNKLIKSHEDGGIKVNKDNLNRAWTISFNNYKKGNYVTSSKYLLLTLVTGTILLNRNKALTNAFGTSSKFSNSGGHMLMCGLLRTDAKNTALFLLILKNRIA